MSSENIKLNFLRINTENNSNFIEDLEIEHLDLQSAIAPYETATIDGMLIKSFRSVLQIPTNPDLLKANIEQVKSLTKLLNIDKNKLNNYINMILSIDYREKFIFSKSNLSLICNILIFVFGELKKYKISTFAEFESKIKEINFSRYDFEKAYLKTEYLEKRSKSFRIPRNNRLNSELISKLSVKEINDDWTEIDDTNINCENKNFGNVKGIPYIEDSYENYIYSSLLTKDYNYDEEQTYNKLLTSKCFQFTKTNKEEAILPIELIILLYKLKNVKTLIFQIKNADEHFIKMARFILMNYKWLFLNKIEEIKYDLNDEQLQKELYIEFNKRTAELFEDYNIPKYFSYFSCHNSRKHNFWTPEGDVIFEKVSFNKIKDYIYNQQSDLNNNTFDNIICNIYNEYGLITNFKYIMPILYTFDIISRKKEFFEEQNVNTEDNESLSYYHNNSIGIFNKNDRKVFGSFSLGNNPRNSNPSIQLNPKKDNTTEKTTSSDFIKDFMKNNSNSFQLMALYLYFLKDFQKLKKFSIYFDFSHSLEIKHMFSLTSAIYERLHFLIFANNISTLIEANFSFNSLDNIAFENILGIIKKNKNLTSLKMSLFSQEILYTENLLSYLWSEKKLSVNKLIKEKNEFLIQTNADMERNLVYFILHNNKIIDDFIVNMKNLFNVLKFERLDNLEEIVFRFDIPLQILNSEKYRCILIKFIINMLIALSLQKNKIKTFKILAPELPMDAKQMPLIKQFFNEIKEVNEGKEKEEKSTEKKIVKGSSIKDKINKLQNSLNKRMLSSETNVSHSKPTKKNQDSFQSNITKNETLEDLTLNLKFYNLPEIFNIISINNMENLKKINIGFLDEATFISFINDYKNNYEKLTGLISLKVSLCPSVIVYTNINKYILEYINIDSPLLEEKYLFSNLKIDSEENMNILINNVYYISKVSKLVVQIGNNNDNINLLSQSNKKLLNDREGMYSLRMIMDTPKYEKIRVQAIINKLASFYSKKENRIIICNENPNETETD